MEMVPLFAFFFPVHGTQPPFPFLVIKRAFLVFFFFVGGYNKCDCRFLLEAYLSSKEPIVLLSPMVPYADADAVNV